MKRFQSSSPWLLAGLALFAAALLWKSGRFDPLWSASPVAATAGPGGWTPAAWLHLVPEGLPAREGMGFESWTRTGEPELFPHSRMPEKIDGAIAHFDRWGVKGLVVAGFAARDPGGGSVELAVYEMGSPVDAFGVLQSLRPPGAASHSLGEGGWSDRTTVAFRAGPLFVLVVGHQHGGLVEGAAYALAEAAARAAPRTPAGKGGMEALALLPEEDRNPGSEKYFRRDPFAGGYPFLENVFVSDHGDPPVTLLVSRPPGGARRALEEWRSALSGTGTPQAVEGLEASLLGEGLEGWEGGVARGPFLLGAVGAPDREAALEWLGLLAARAERSGVHGR